MASAVTRFVLSITPGEVLAGAAVSIGLLLVALASAVLVVTLWPPDYFVRATPLWAERHPAVRLLGHFAHNALGIVLVLVGVVLSVPGVPGPGFAVIFIGLTLVDFPGKRRVERWVLRLPAVHRAIDRIRARYGREPLILVEDEADRSDRSNRTGATSDAARDRRAS